MKATPIGIAIICIFFITRLSAQPSGTSVTNFPSGKTYSNSKITYKLISNQNNTWGYNILVDDKIMIHQPTKPASSGNDGFKSKADAQKVAELVIEKMKKGENPPSVSEEELKKMKIL